MVMNFSWQILFIFSNLSVQKFCILHFPQLWILKNIHSFHFSITQIFNFHKFSIVVLKIPFNYLLNFPKFSMKPNFPVSWTFHYENYRFSSALDSKNVNFLEFFIFENFHFPKLLIDVFSGWKFFFPTHEKPVLTFPRPPFYHSLDFSYPHKSPRPMVNHTITPPHNSD